jgi:hypothetical protein
VAHIDKPAFTRADLVELVGALVPVDVPGDPRALIEQIVDMVGACPYCVTISTYGMYCGQYSRTWYISMSQPLLRKMP